MAEWHIRDFTPEDLEDVVRLDTESPTTGEPPVFGLSDVVASLQADHPAVVALVEETVIGAAVSRVDGDRAWILRISLHPMWRQMGLGSALLHALEQRLGAAKARTLTAVLPEGETGVEALRNSGFTPRSGLVFFEKTESTTPHEADVLAALGAERPPAVLWEKVAGMNAEKELIERRLVLPLAHPELAEEHGVEPPRAVVLFGPPGTGKSTFARAVAGRLNWPLIELYPSRLASGEGLATGLSRRFEEIALLDRVLVFIDEVEEVAAERRAGDPYFTGVVNELLKAIVKFRGRDDRLLVCATNNVTALDPAFLRHGRFDYVLPIGPPDHDARVALWQSFLDRAGAKADAEVLAAASDGFTPADIGHAARTVAQTMFERTVETGRRVHPTTEDYLRTIRHTRPTVSALMAQEFKEQTSRFART